MSFFAEAPQPMATTRWNLKLALKSLRQVPKQQWVVAEPSVPIFSVPQTLTKHTADQTLQNQCLSPGLQWISIARIGGHCPSSAETRLEILPYESFMTFCYVVGWFSGQWWLSMWLNLCHFLGPACKSIVCQFDLCKLRDGTHFGGVCKRVSLLEWP